MIAKAGVDILIAIGPAGAEIAKEASLKGILEKIYLFPNIKYAYPFWEKILDENTILLAKCCMYDAPFKNLLKNLL